MDIFDAHPDVVIQGFISGGIPIDSTQADAIDQALDDLAASVYDVPSGLLNARKLAQAVIDKLCLCDEGSRNYAYVHTLLCHEDLQIACEAEGRQCDEQEC